MTHRATALVMGPLVLALAACTGGAPDAPSDIAPAYVAEIDAFLAGTPSDFERDVLADHRVTDAEIRQAQELFVRCAADAGYDATYRDDQLELVASDGRSTRTGDDQAESDAMGAVADRCNAGTTDFVGYIYAAVRDNPEARTQAELVRDCFSRHDLTDGADLDDAAFERTVLDPAYEPSSAQARRCVIDPAGLLDPAVVDQMTRVEQLDIGR